ncbi:MAG: hypothetical protein ACQEXX_31655 [Bacillota bacterium]
MKMHVFNSRIFNNVTYDPVQGTVTKRSNNEEKLKDEIFWYRNIPAELSDYTPYMKDYSLDPQNVYLTMDFIPWPTVSSLFLSPSINKGTDWEKFFSSIQNLFNKFSRYSGELPLLSLRYIYIEKTIDRMSLFIEKNSFFRKVKQKGSYLLNGRSVECPFTILEKNRKSLLKLILGKQINIIHGDMCFSNIFFNNDDGKLFLIDPRGSFGQSGVYGDPRYDLAKIRHSLSGYDHIINDQYYLQVIEEKLELNFSIKKEHHQLLVANLWDEIIGRNLIQIQLIEALLFLSMTPLHKDSTQRQMIMFGLGTELLNKALDY